MAAIRAPARPAAPAQLSLKLGKFGAFVGCSNYPECRYTRTAVAADGRRRRGGRRPGVQVLGNDPVTGAEVTLRDGRFGPMSSSARGEKPKRSSPAQGHEA